MRSTQKFRAPWPGGPGPKSVRTAQESSPKFAIPCAPRTCAPRRAVQDSGPEFTMKQMTLELILETQKSEKIHGR